MQYILAGIAAGGGAGLFFGGGWVDVGVSAVLGSVVGALGGVCEGQRILDKMYEVSVCIIQIPLRMLSYKPQLRKVHRCSYSRLHCTNAHSPWCSCLLLCNYSLFLHIPSPGSNDYTCAGGTRYSPYDQRDSTASLWNNNDWIDWIWA